jgi:hypothetical protein
MNLIQLKTKDGERRVGIVSGGDTLKLLSVFETTYDLAQAAIGARKSIVELVAADEGDGTDSYDAVIAEGRLLVPLDHPDPAHCIVTGTGLTHLGSADARDQMHKNLGEAETLTDSMKMFRDGLTGGKPAGGQPGVQPEWFYKGDGSAVVAGEQPLTMPDFALDGGEEPEITGCYLIGPDGTPWRVGFAIGNEFSDHITERQNYLLLAHSKLRQCAVGPELLVGPLPDDVRGTSRITRDGKTIWEKPFLSGEANMSHWIANLEHHHFKYALFRRPGDVHLHFFGTATLSVSDGIKPEPGDRFEIEAAAFGRPLRNPLARAAAETVTVRAL